MDVIDIIVNQAYNDDGAGIFDPSSINNSDYDDDI